MDMVFDFISGLVGINIRDPHEIPFAAPLVTASLTGFIIGFMILKGIDREQIRNRSDKEGAEDRNRTGG